MHIFVQYIHLGLLLRRLADQDGVVILHKGGGWRDHAHSDSVNLHVLLVEGVASYLRSTVTMETISRDVKP